MAGGRFSSWLRLILIAGLLLGALRLSHPAIAANHDTAPSAAVVLEAQESLKRGDPAAAASQLRKILDKNPENGTARLMLARAYLAMGDGRNAEYELEVLIERFQGGKEVRFMLAEAYLKQSKFDLALEAVADVPGERDKSLRTLLLRGRAYLGLNRIDESAKSFRAAERLRPRSVVAKVGLARGLILRRRFAAAEILVDAALAIKPNEISVVVLKAELRRLDRDLKSALAYFDRAMAIKGDYLPARLGRAASLIDMNREAEAEADIDAVYARVPRHPIASYLSALVLFKKKDFTGAGKALQRGGPTLNRHLPSLVLAGEINYALNRIEPAIRNLSRYVKLVPGNKRAVKLLAAALLRANKPGKVIRLLEPLIRRSTKDAHILTLAGSAYMRLGKYDKGTVLFEKAAEAAPNVAAMRTQLALGRLFSGQSDKAIGDLEAAVDIDPGARRASILLTQIQLRRGKFDAALKSASALKSRMPDNPIPENLIGAAYLGKGDAEKARQSFERALKANPDFHSARINLARLDRREKKTGAAIAHLELIVKKSPNHLGAMLDLAVIAESERRAPDAVSWLNRASASNPKAILPRLRLVQYLERRRQFQKAVTVARELARSHPGTARVLVALGRNESAAGEHVAAVASFRRLIELAPKSASAMVLLAGAQIAAKDDDSARRSLRKALSLDENALKAHVTLANLELRTGRTKAAMKIAKTLQRKYPRSAVGFVLIGDIYMRRKDYGYALKAYEMGLRKEDTGTVVLRRFHAQRAMGRAKKAFSALQKWVDRKNSRPLRHFLAAAYINAKRFDDAIRESEKLLAKDANNPFLLNNLAWLYDRTGDRRALPTAEKAMSLAPKSPVIMDTLGWMLVRKGRVRDGVALLEKATELAPGQGNIGYRYARALRKAGQSEKARRALKKLLGSGIKFSESENARAFLKELGG